MRWDEGWCKLMAVSLTLKKLNMIHPAWQRQAEPNSGQNKKSPNKIQDDCKDSTYGENADQIHDNEYVVVEIGI